MKIFNIERNTDAIKDDFKKEKADQLDLNKLVEPLNEMSQKLNAKINEESSLS